MTTLRVPSATVTGDGERWEKAAVSFGGGTMSIDADGRHVSLPVAAVQPYGARQWRVTLSNGAVLTVRKDKGCGCR